MGLADDFMLDVKKPAFVKRKKADRYGMKSEMSVSQAMELAQRIETYAPYANTSCVRGGVMLQVDFTAMGDSKFGMADVVGGGNVHKCKCCPEMDVESYNVYDRARFCFKQMATGKCVDKYVRHTVGYALFPQYYASNNVVKEKLTGEKMREIFGGFYKYIKYFNFENWRYDDGTRVHSNSPEAVAFSELKQRLKDDVQFNKMYELVAVVGMTTHLGGRVVTKSFARAEGQLIVSPQYQKPGTGFMDETGMAGTIVVRSKKTGKIMQMSPVWMFVGKFACVSKDGSLHRIDIPFRFAGMLNSDNNTCKRLIQMYATNHTR